MGSIKLLDKETINKIAAGEVVDRPFSVVKELIENSIDSGASQITCEIKDGGKSYIRISDNGKGFDPDDVKIAFLRHATSKISGEEDLDKITSLGFRGEALSSVSAVSKVELLSKRREDFLGIRYVIEGGEEKSFEEAGCPDGTTIIVRDLFYNVPARKKFLKSNMTETGYIGDCLNRLAASHPEIAFRFINQGKTMLFTNGNGNEKDALYSIYGRDIASNLIKISYKSEAFEVEGYIGKPVILRGNRICENYYINGRYSKSPIITKSIEEAYKGYAMHYKYPFTSLHFNFPIDKLDVNVHPSKMEVRILDGDFYYARICQLVSEALHNANLIVDSTIMSEKEEKTWKGERTVSNAVQAMPQSFETNRLDEFKKEITHSVNLDPDNPLSAFRNPVEPKVDNEFKAFVNSAETKTDNGFANTETAKANNGFEDFASAGDTWSNNGFAKEENGAYAAPSSAEINRATDTVYPTEGKFEQMSFMAKEEFMNDKELTRFKIIGQVFETYWIIEMDDNMFMIDQHAAHEKILYERFMKKYQENRMYSQQLYPSLIVSLTLSEKNVLTEYWDYFKRLGFVIEPFGDREYQITAVPVDLFDFSEEEFFKDVLDQLAESPLKGEIDHVVTRIATMSCKAAIKGNQRISVMEAETLIKELLGLDNPYHCPHGRPTIITITKTEIEKKFKRII